MTADSFPDHDGVGLVVRSDIVPDLGDDVRLQQLWLSLQQRSWRSLAVLAGDEGLSTLETANAIARLAWWYTGVPSCVFDMRDLSLRLLEYQIRDMGKQLQGGERVFVALRSLTENPTAAPLAMASDAVVLCVALGSTQIKRAVGTIESVGRERFLGTIVVKPPAPKSTAIMRRERPKGRVPGNGRSAP